MKILKFKSDLVPKILSGEKEDTWRFFDDKNLKEGEEIEFLENGKAEPFARAQITKIIEKKTGELTPEEKQSRGFKLEEEIYRHYTEIYRCPVGPDTVVKIISFKLR